MMSAEFAIFTSINLVAGMAKKPLEHSFDNWTDVFPGSTLVEFDEPDLPLSEMVKYAESDSDADILMYANAGILFRKSHVKNLLRSWNGRLPDIFFGDFLLIGPDTEIMGCSANPLTSIVGINYFVFKRGMFHDFAKALVGADFCDALVAQCLHKGIPVINAGIELCVGHQSNSVVNFADEPHKVWNVWELSDNLLVPRNECCTYDPVVATHILLDDGKIVSKDEHDR